MKETRYAELGSILSGAIRSKTQKEVADWCGVTQPAVNGWLRGYTLPRKSHLAILAIYLKLDPRELALATRYKPEEILNLYEASFAGEGLFRDCLESERQKVEWVHDLWIRGDPKTAIDWSNIIEHNLQEILKNNSSSSKRQKLVHRLRSENLLELGCAYSASLPTRKAYKSIIRVFEQQEKIAEKFGDDEPRGRASFNQGDAYYGQKQYYEARFYYSVAADLMQDPYWKAEAVRATGLCCAYLVNAGHEKYKAEFQRTETQIQDMLDRGRFSDPVTAATSFEFMARGQALLDHPYQAFKILEKGNKVLAEAKKQGEKAVHREIQLIRAEIIALLQLKEDMSTIERLAKKGLELANYHGFSRYAEDFEGFLKKLHA